MNVNGKRRGGGWAQWGWAGGAALALAVWGRAEGATPEPAAWPKRWVYAPANLYVGEELARLDALLTRAARAGYNGVLFSDFKTMTWWTLDDAARWQANAGKLRARTRALGLELTVAVCPFGRAEALLWHDPNLAAGMPIRAAPLVCRAGVLTPEPTATLWNGSFEEHAGDTARGFGFQDDPGRRSFLDARVVRQGRVSLRFDMEKPGNAAGNGRICQTVKVQPWQQYRLRAWLKTERLTGDEIRLMVMAGDRILQWEHLARGEQAQRRYLGQVRDLTLDWTEQTVAFNSLEHSEVRIYAGVWGGRAGSLWWDDLRLEAAPGLNLVRRDDLPTLLRTADGRRLEEGRDVLPLTDPGLGNRPWKGCYDTWHEPPVWRVPEGSRLREGDRVLFDGWHTALVYEGQVGSSWLNPAVLALCREQVRRVRQALEPDGWFLSHDEIRSGGWEPAETVMGTAGKVLAENARRCVALLREEAPGRPVYIWSDMFDPAHNARENFYLVRDTLAGAWEGLDRGVVVMKWMGGEAGRKGLQHFATRGHSQMVAAYYDGAVADDHAQWQQTSRGVAGLSGVMYTTWQGRYDDLERFAATWWGGGKR